MKIFKLAIYTGEFYLCLIVLNGFQLLLYNKGGWFRLFGKGFSWKLKSEGLTFSQRNGRAKYLCIFGLVFSPLKKETK